MKDKSKSILIIGLILIVIGGICTLLTLNNQKKPQKSPTEPQKQNEYAFVYANDNKQIIGVKKDGNIVKLIDDANTMYDGYDISNELLYYVDKDDYVHTLSLDENLTDTKTETKINSKFWDMKVDNNNIFVFGLSKDWFTELYKSNGDILKMPFVSNNREFFLDNNFYYTDRSDKILKKYNLDTNESLNITSGEGRCLALNSTSLLYISEDSICLYDIMNNTSKIIISNVEQSSNYSPDLLVLNNNDVFYINKDKLYKYSNNETKEVLDLKNKDYDYNEYKIVNLNDHELLVLRANYKAEDCDYGCEGGVIESLIFDTKKNELHETPNNFEELYHTYNTIIYVK